MSEVTEDVGVRPDADAAGSGPGPATRPAGPATVVVWLARGFVTAGVLPLLMVLALGVFTALSEQFLTVDNLLSALRQNSYVVIITLAQFVVLLSGGFDLSVGSATALVSVSTAMVMASATRSGAGDGRAIGVGITAGLAVGLAVGLVNAIGVGWLRINPFIMTLASASVFQGLALRLTSGVPVYGMPPEFSARFGFAEYAGIALPVWVAALAALGLWVLLTWTRPGRHLYAVGSNPHAAVLSGVSPGRALALAYATAGVLVGIGAVLLTARLETGEANIGASLPLQTIAAAVIGGVSLRGGSGRVSDAVLGALFIGLVVNGMDLARAVSYYQMIVLGVVLAVAVLADRLRHRVALWLPTREA